MYLQLLSRPIVDLTACVGSWFVHALHGSCGLLYALALNRQIYDLMVPALLSLYSFFLVFTLCFFLTFGSQIQWLWWFLLESDLDFLIHLMIQIYLAWAHLFFTKPNSFNFSLQIHHSFCFLHLFHLNFFL